MAFCQYCGNEIPDDSKFCPNCGATLDVQRTAFQPNSHMDYGYDATLPMNWYKFLIYFALFLGALSNANTGIQMVTGGHYDGYASYVYSYFPVLKTIDIVMGIACIAIAVFAIVVRQKLANYKMDGPKMLLYLYLANMAISLVYVLLLMMIVGSEFVDFTLILPSVVVSVIMIFVNKTYFDKRSHLFVN